MRKSLKNHKQTIKLYKKTRLQNAEVSSYLTEVDENLLTVKGLRAEEKVGKDFNNKLASYQKAKKSQKLQKSIDIQEEI
jgi:ABC-type bacteriocin/lantibiotic exporter with double-glycine peptidase domain